MVIDQPTGGLVTPMTSERVAVDWSEGALSGPLSRSVPPGAKGVLRIGLDGIEALGFHREGIAGVFREGSAFLPWKHIVTFTRGATFGAAVQLHTEHGRRYTLADFRLSGVGKLLDRLYAGEAAQRTAPSEVRSIQTGGSE